MKGCEILQRRINELNQALQKHPSSTQWEYCVASAGLSSPPDAAYTPVTGILFKAEAHQDIWLKTIYRTPTDIAGLPVKSSRFYLTANTIINPVDVYVNHKTVMSVPFWADFTRPEILLSEQATDTEYRIDICLRESQPMSAQGIHFLPWFQVEVVDQLLFFMSALLQECRYLAALPEAKTALAKVDALLIERAESCSFAQMQALIDDAHRLLEPIRDVAKQHTVHVISHAHIDIDWQWDREDTYNVCCNDFSTMTALMEEFPDFTFSQSQPCLYQYVKERDPDLFEKIRDRVQRGQWDVSNAVRWTESDLNMPEGESIAHSILYGNRFILEEFGKYPSVSHEPDTFGHPETMPQILHKSGVHSYFHMRGDAENILHSWTALDRYELLAIADQYKGVLDLPRLISNVLRYMERHELDCSLFMFGVGDHGGGPSRRDIRKIHMLDGMPGMPKMLHSSLEAFFKEVRSKCKPGKLPQYKGELGPVFEGCYTTHGDIKMWHRRLESLLLQAEWLQAAERNMGKAPDEAMLESAWKQLLTMQFHDTVCGCSVAETYQRACREAQETCETLRAYLGKGLAAAESDQIITVSNLLPFARTEPVLLKGKGNMSICTLQGQVVPSQTVKGDLLFVPDTIPSGGQVCYRLTEREMQSAPVDSDEIPNNGWFDTDYFSLRIDPSTGILERMFDKRNGKKYIYSRDFTPEPMNGYPFQFENNLFRVDYEMPHYRRSAWIIGPIHRRENLFGGEIKRISSGEIADVLEIRRTVSHSTVVQQVIIYKHLPRIDFNQEVDWQEQSAQGQLAPMLLLHFHPELSGKITASREIPFGVSKTAPNGEVHACLRWADVSDETGGFTVVNDSKYGCSVNGSTLTMHCIRTPFHPDPDPDRGLHHFRFALYPHIGACDDTEATRLGRSFNAELLVLPGKTNEALSAPVQLAEGEAVVSTVKPAYRQEGFIVRLYTVLDRPVPFRLKAGAPIKYAQEVLITEDRPTAREFSIEGDELRGMLQAGEMLTLHMVLQK